MSKLLFKIVLQDVESIHSSIENRADMCDFRQDVLKSFSPMVKTAFDTRRTNQELEYNPRRNLQYYHRSDPFITKTAVETIKTFFKLKTAADSIREDFATDPNWMDSYCRVLCAALDRTLRIDQKDMDFAQPQIDYLNELLYLRYRLKDEDIIRLDEKELRGILLSRDEKLSYRSLYANYQAQAPIVKGQDQLMDKLFSDVLASKENKEVERSVTITINDKIKEDIKKES
jgi:hypothetical protein